MRNRKKDKMNKIILLGLVILFFIYPNKLTYAINYSNGEFKPRPAIVDSNPISPPSQGDDTSGQSDDTVTHNYVAGIGGNVKEIIESIHKQELGNKGQDSSGIITNKGIKNIYVEADNGASTKTDENGNYYFPLNPGESIHKITFKYGYLDENYIESTTVGNYKERQEILKYNGQDYSVIANEYINTIALTQKGCAQVYLVLDCSVSTNDQITLSDGTRTTKLQIEKQIATNIVNSLLDGSKNVYVGLVVFTGEVYRKTSLTNDRNLLLNAINGDIEFNDDYYTNIKEALEKAYDSYANNIKETSNRYMFLLSDGLPTADGDESHTLYAATSQAEIEENNAKLQLIANNTKNTAQRILQEEVKLYSIFTMEDLDESDKNLVNYIFNEFDQNSEYNTFRQVDSIENISSEIIEEFVQYVKDSIEITNTGYQTNKNYREELLEENYAKFNYKNTYYFQALDMEVTAENLETFKQYLRELVTKTTVTIELQTSATGESPITAYDETENITNEAGEIIGTRTIHHVPNPVQVTGPTLTLQQLPEFTLNPTITVTGLGVIAQNGIILDSLTTTIEEKEHLISTIEEVLLYGSEVRVQYTIDVKNTSIYNDCENIQMLCYIPDDFEYRAGTAIGIGIDGEIELGLSSAIVIDKNNVDSLNSISQEVKNYIKQGHKAIAVSVAVNRNNFQLLTNGSVQIKLMVSKLLSSKLEDMTYGTDTEILGYKNDSYRRIQYKATSNNYRSAQAVGLVGAVAGNHDTTEADYATTSNLGVVITPTGKDKRNETIYLAVIILGIIGVMIKKQLKK